MRASTRSPSMCPKVSFTSLNLSRSIRTTENGRPEREARFHSADKPSQKKRRVVISVRPSVTDCWCSFWEAYGLADDAVRRSAKVVGKRTARRLNGHEWWLSQ